MTVCIMPHKDVYLFSNVTEQFCEVFKLNFVIRPSILFWIFVSYMISVQVPLKIHNVDNNT